MIYLCVGGQINKIQSKRILKHIAYRGVGLFEQALLCQRNARKITNYKACYYFVYTYSVNTYFYIS